MLRVIKMILGIISGVIFGIVEFKHGPKAKTKINFGPLKDSKLYLKKHHVHYSWAALLVSLVSSLIGSYDFAFFSGIMSVYGILPQVDDTNEPQEMDEFDTAEEPELVPEISPYDVSTNK